MQAVNAVGSQIPCFCCISSYISDKYNDEMASHFARDPFYEKIPKPGKPHEFDQIRRRPPKYITEKQLVIWKKVMKRAWYHDRNFCGCMPIDCGCGMVSLISAIPILGSLIAYKMHYKMIKMCAQAGCPASILAAMGGNATLDFAITLVPLLGVLLSWMKASSTRNVGLFDDWLRGESDKHQKLLEKQQMQNNALNQPQAAAVPSKYQRPGGGGAPGSGVPGTTRAPVAQGSRSVQNPNAPPTAMQARAARSAQSPTASRTPAQSPPATRAQQPTDRQPPKRKPVATANAPASRGTSPPANAAAPPAPMAVPPAVPNAPTSQGPPQYASRSTATPSRSSPAGTPPPAGTYASTSPPPAYSAPQYYNTQQSNTPPPLQTYYNVQQSQARPQQAPGNAPRMPPPAGTYTRPPMTYYNVTQGTGSQPSPPPPPAQVMYPRKQYYNTYQGL